MSEPKFTVTLNQREYEHIMKYKAGNTNPKQEAFEYFREQIGDDQEAVCNACGVHIGYFTTPDDYGLNFLCDACWKESGMDELRAKRDLERKP